MTSLKPPTTYEEQLDILRQRNIIISNEAQCLSALERIHYYRLTAYLLPFKQADQTYLRGTTLDIAYELYEFDRHLRILMLTAIEEIELFFRSKLSYFHSHNYGALGYMKPENFSSRCKHQKFIENFNREIERNQTSLIIKHHKQNYEGHFPLWVAVEFFSFGMLSRFYADLTTKDRKYLSKDMYGHNSESSICSWLQCCTNLRNICAHYGRLYYRDFSAVPKGAPCDNVQSRRLFGAVFALKSLYPDPEKWNQEILSKLNTLIDENTHISLDHLGFPENWEALLR